MAKLPFTKLGLKKNQEIKTLTWNEQAVEIKQYLPMQEKLQLMSKVINLSHDKDSNYSNPIKVDIYTKLNIIENYTNITFTDKQKEDVCKLYDLFKESGLIEEIFNVIPEQEIMEIENSIKKAIKSIYAYQNSVMGILDNVSSDYSNLNLDALNIQEALGDPNNLTLLKQIIDKLG